MSQISLLLVSYSLFGCCFIVFLFVCFAVWLLVFHGQHSSPIDRRVLFGLFLLILQRCELGRPFRGEKIAEDIKRFMLCVLVSGLTYFTTKILERNKANFIH
jgi:hypothetical protein